MRNDAFYLTTVMVSAIVDIYTVAFWMLGFTAVAVFLLGPALLITWPASKAAKRWAEGMAAILTKQ